MEEKKDDDFPVGTEGLWILLFSLLSSNVNEPEVITIWCSLIKFVPVCMVIWYHLVDKIIF